MSKRKPRWLPLLLVGTAAYGAWHLASWLREPEVQDARRLTNQVWISRMPSGPRDVVGHLTVIQPKRGKRIGAVGHSSRFRFNIELFGWSLEGDRLALFFPQERVRAEFQARTWSCAGEAPEPFELCLELAANGRKVMFYSREDWVIDPPRRHELPAEVAARTDAFVPPPDTDFAVIDLAAFDWAPDALAQMEASPSEAPR